LSSRQVAWVLHSYIQYKNQAQKRTDVITEVDGHTVVSAHHDAQFGATRRLDLWYHAASRKQRDRPLCLSRGLQGALSVYCCRVEDHAKTSDSLSFSSSSAPRSS